MSSKIKFYNNTTEDLTFGSFGEGGSSTFRKVVNAGQRFIANDIYEGDRVFVAWNEFTDEFYPDSTTAVTTLTVPDGKKITAKFDDNGWAFAQLADGQADFPDD